MRVRICTLHEDDFFQCRVIAMVVLALILNELFLLASHLLPVDPVYLFRHRITRNGRNRTCSVVIPPFLLSRPLPSRSQRLPCSKVSYYPRPPLREDPQFPTFRYAPYPQRCALLPHCQTAAFSDFSLDWFSGYQQEEDSFYYLF